MRRFSRGLVFLGLLLGRSALLSYSQASPSVAAPPPITATFEADTLEVDLDHHRIQARGSASFSYGSLTLHADQFTADRSTGEMEASGNLRFTQGGRRLQGESLRYNTLTEEGVLTKAQVAEQGVFIRGESVLFSPTQIVAHQASFTTCDRPHPHYTFGADTISLTAAQSTPGKPPQSGRLTLDRARVTYRDRPLFTVPRYSVSVGQLAEPDSTPLPATGFSRDDGPYASISYTLGGPGDLPLADLNYRYTTFRGIRGHLLARRSAGPLELVAGYVRREDPSDRGFRPGDLEASLANVLVNRAPEYGVRLPEFALGPSLRLRAEWLRGSYSERLPWAEETRARADRTATDILLAVQPYQASQRVTLSHAVGWRHATYSAGDSFTLRSHWHTADLDLTRRVHLSLTYLARRSSGHTPFLFDDQGPGRELLGEVKLRVNPRWRLRVLDLYNLEERKPRDIMFELTRTAHCLAYTIGWRKARGRFYLGIGLAPPSADGAAAWPPLGGPDAVQAGALPAPADEMRP